MAPKSPKSLASGSRVPNSPKTPKTPRTPVNRSTLGPKGAKTPPAPMKTVKKTHSLPPKKPAPMKKNNDNTGGKKTTMHRYIRRLDAITHDGYCLVVDHGKGKDKATVAQLVLKCRNK